MNAFTFTRTARRLAVLFVCGLATLAGAFTTARAQPAEEIYPTVTIGFAQNVPGITTEYDGKWYHGKVKPWKKYTVNFGWWQILPPAGYDVYVDGVKNHTGTFTNSNPRQVVVRPKVFLEGLRVGEASNIDPGPFVWGVGLGDRINGRSAGHLFFAEEEFNPLTTPACLQYTNDAEEVEVIRRDQVIRQVKAAQALVDIVPITWGQYELRFYRPQDVGSKEPEYDENEENPIWVYSVSGTPFVKYKINASNWSSGISIEKTIGSRTETVSIAKVGAGLGQIDGGYIKSEFGGARVTTRLTSENNYSEDARWEEVTTVKDQAGTVHAQVMREMWVMPWGIRPKKVVVDPAGLALTTQYTYATEGAARGKITQVAQSDGRIMHYEYWDDDTLSSDWYFSGLLKSVSNEYDKQITSYWDSDTPRRVEYEKGANPYGKTTYNHSHSTFNGEPVQDTSTTRYSNSVKDQEPTGDGMSYGSGVSYYRRELSNSLYVYLPLSITNADLTSRRYRHAFGSYDPATKVFTVSTGGKAMREHAFDVQNGSGGGIVSISSLDGINEYSSPAMTPRRSTKQVAIRDARANLVRQETHVFTGTVLSGEPQFELIDWTDYVYDDACRLIQTTNSRGQTTSVTWTNGLKSSETDASGVSTSYTYDSLLRVATKTVQSFAGSGAIPAQSAIVTTYTYEGCLGRVTQESTASGGITLSANTTYDKAGRITQQTNTEGVATSYAYTQGGRVITETHADGGTKVVTHKPYRGTIEKIEGTAVVKEYHDDGWYAGERRIRYGDPNSLVTKLTRVDWQNRPMYESVGNSFRFHYYNNRGQLAETGINSYTNFTPSSGHTFFTYDNLGEQSQAGIDADGNQSITVASADRITTTTRDVVKEGSDWWAVTTSKAYSQAGQSTLVTTGVVKKRLSGFTGGLLEETKSIDIHGNVATRTVTANAATQSWVERTTSPASSVAEEVTYFRGRKLTHVTAQNLTLTWTYDAMGRLTAETDPRTGTRTIGYVTNSPRVAWRKDPSNRQTSYTYDAMGRVVAEQRPDGQVTRSRYGLRGELTHVWGGATYPVMYVYDEYIRKVEMHTFRGGSGWDGATWPTGTTGTADVTKFTYNNYHELTKKEDAAGKSTTYTYTGSPSRLRSIISPQGREIYYTHDGRTGDLLKTGPSTSPSADDVTYTYDRLGNVATVTDAAGTRTFTYDATGTLALQQEALPAFLGSRILKRKYAASGVIGRDTGYQLGTSGTPAADAEMTYGYDTYGRLNAVSAAFAGGAARTVDYGYLANSNLLGSIAQPSSGFAMTRLYASDRDLLTTTSAAVGSTVQAAYTYAYDDLGRRTSVIQTGELFTGYVAATPGLVEKYAYNARSELTAAGTFVGNTVSTTIALPGRDYAYTYDAIGNRTQTVTNGRTEAYTANSLNQYTARDVAGYYDVAGLADDAATVTVNTLSTQRSHEYFHRAAPFANTINPVYGDVTIAADLAGTVTSQTGKAFLAQSPEAFTYDFDGNLTQDGRWDYTWDYQQRLSTMETRAIAVAQGVPKRKLAFTYDYLHRRIQKRVYAWVSGAWSLTADTRFLYDGWNLIAEYDYLTSAVTRRYAWGIDFSGTVQGAGGVGGLLLVQGGGTTYLAGHDGRGHVTVLVDAASGTLAAAYEYGPYGELLRCEGLYATGNPFRFSTKYTDDETGLVYHNRRYYSPSQGRFLGRDPIEEEGGINLYAYCGNNGINRWDLLGMEWGVFDDMMAYQAELSGGFYDPIGRRTVYGNLVDNDPGGVNRTVISQEQAQALLGGDSHVNGGEQIDARNGQVIRVDGASAPQTGNVSIGQLAVLDGSTVVPVDDSNRNVPTTLSRASATGSQGMGLSDYQALAKQLGWTGFGNLSENQQLYYGKTAAEILRRQSQGRDMGGAWQTVLADVPGITPTDSDRTRFVAVLIGAGALGTMLSGEGGALGSLTPSQVRQIQAFVNRFQVDVSVVGSRAAGTAGPLSDFDYVVGGNSSVRGSAEYYLPRGNHGGANGSGIDVFNGNKTPVNPNLPNIRFSPNRPPIVGGGSRGNGGG